MANVNFAGDQNTIYQAVGGKKFAKKSTIDIPANYRISVWQNGAPVGTAYGPQVAVLSKKQFPNLKAGFFAKEIDCEVFYEKTTNHIFRETYMHKEYKYGNSEKIKGTFTLYCEFILEDSDTVGLHKFGIELSSLTKKPPLVLDKGVRAAMTTLVCDYMAKNLANNDELMFELDYVAKEKANRSECEAQFLKGLETYVEDELKKQVGLIGRCNALGLHDNITL